LLCTRIIRACSSFSSVRHAAHQVVPGGDDAGEGYRLRFDRDINVKLPSNV
jgi:hypothetical protein